MQGRRGFRLGEVILGRYRVTGELGQGGMGVVYRCHDEVGGIDVALKALPPELSHNTSEMEEVRENFRMVERLHHPHIAAVKTLERDSATGDYYLILELAEGVDLRRWRKSKGGKVSLGEVVPVLEQVARALDYAHSQRIVHRDVKPSNIMLGSEGVVKVLDFGLAAQIQSSLSRVSQVHHGTSGTGPYMAPEQWRGQLQDGATDQYALAVVAYELLAGRVPFDSQDAVALRECVIRDEPLPPEGLAEAVWRGLACGLAKGRRDRFQSCEGFVKALAGQAPGRESKQPAERAVAPEAVGRGKAVGVGRAGRKLVWAAAAVMGFLLVVALMKPWRWGDRASVSQSSQPSQPPQSSQPVAPSTGRGGLVVSTEPEGAEVALGGDHLEKSPATFRGVTPGKYPLKVMLDGYEPVTREVEIRADDFAKLEPIRLRRSSGSVRIVSDPPGATVRRQGTLVGVTPLAIDSVLVGEVAYDLVLPRFASATVRGTVRRNERLDLTASLKQVAPLPGKRWTNTLGMVFVPVAGVAGLVSAWETRVQDYQAFVSSAGRSWTAPGFGQQPDHPAVHISWEDASEFCRWLTQKERSGGRLEADQQYRLPKDAEWSVAAGLTGEKGTTPEERESSQGEMFAWGKAIWPPPKGAGNFASALSVDSYEYTAPVGKMGATATGLCDLAGNVWEWCEDRYGTRRLDRVLRGGSWYAGERARLSLGYRSFVPSTEAYDDVGFRCVLEPEKR